MATFLQVFLSGLATGSIYALAAIGFALVWQAAQTVNFAQGEFVVLPAFFVLVGINWLQWPLWLAIIFSLACSILVLGVLFKWVIVDPLLKKQSLSFIIASMGVSLLLKESMKTFYSAQAQPYPSVFPTSTFNLGGAILSVQDVCIVVAALAIVLGLTAFLDRTRTGRAMQATAQNPAVAEILGVNVKRMVMYTFLVNALLASLAAFMVSPIYLAKFDNGEGLGTAAFIAAIVGGFNQVRGALVGGLLVGVLGNLTATYVTASYRSALPLVLLIIIILIRPQGIMGTAESREV